MTSFEQSVLNVAGVQSGHIHTMWTVLMYVCSVMYVLVVAFLAWALLRSRDAGNPDRRSDSAGTARLPHWTALRRLPRSAQLPRQPLR